MNAFTGQPNETFYLAKGTALTIPVSFRAPRKPGYYDVCAFMVPDPWGVEGQSRSIFVESSIRFTLEVTT